MTDAAALIEQLDLQPHPEGGWYRETWRASADEGERAASTAILFLLEVGQRSHWHRVDADEIWLWHAGGPLDLKIAAGDDGPTRTVRLGPEGDYQAVVPKGAWQSAVPAGDKAVLVGCVVAPGFDFAGFELAEAGWSPGG